MPWKVESVRLGEPVTPADRPVAAERDAEIRVRSEVWWKRLQHGSGQGKQGSAPEHDNESEGEKPEPRNELRPDRRDFFLSTDTDEGHGRLLGSEAESAAFSIAGPWSEHHHPEDALDRDALNEAAERFVSFHVVYDYLTNSYGILVPKLTHELTKSLEAGPLEASAHRNERLWLIQAVLDAASARAPQDKAAIHTALQPLLTKAQEVKLREPTPVSTPLPVPGPEPVFTPTKAAKSKEAPVADEATEPGRGVSVVTDLGLVHVKERLIRATFHNEPTPDEDDEPTVTEFDEATSVTSTATASVLRKPRRKRGTHDRRKKPRGRKDRRRR